MLYLIKIFLILDMKQNTIIILLGIIEFNHLNKINSNAHFLSEI